MKLLSKIFGILRNIAMGFHRLFLFVKNNRLMFSFILVFYAGMMAGEYRDLLRTYLGQNFDTSKTGQNVKVSGDCLFYNGARVTLTNDQLRVIKKDKNRIYGIVVGMAKSVSCLKQNVVIDPYTYAQFLLDGEKPISKFDEKRIVESDPELALIKKTVLISGLCTDRDGRNRNLKSNLAEILSVEGDFERVLNIFLVVQSKTLHCKSGLVKTRLVKDEDVSTFEEDERIRMIPKEPENFVGKMVEVSGSCSLVNPVNKKEISIHFRAQPVLVLGVQKDGDSVMILRGSTAYDRYDAVPITCDRNKEPDIIWSLTDRTIDHANSESVKTQIVSITGSCTLEDGVQETLYEQDVKVSEISKSDGNNIDRVVGFLKIKNVPKRVTCDKKKDKTLQFNIK